MKNERAAHVRDAATVLPLRAIRVDRALSKIAGVTEHSVFGSATRRARDVRRPMIFGHARPSVRRRRVAAQRRVWFDAALFAEIVITARDGASTRDGESRKQANVDLHAAPKSTERAVSIRLKTRRSRAPVCASRARHRDALSEF
jgi:hypothetical protein